MKNRNINKNVNKIRMIDTVSDLALATIILGIAMIVLGTTMIVGSAISMSHGYSLFGGSANLLFFAISHGIAFISDGILLSVFGLLVATTNPLANSFGMLRGFSLFCMIFDSVVLVAGAVLGANIMGIIVSLSGLAISGIIAYLITKMRVTAERMSQSQAYHTVNKLRKVS